MSNIFIISAPSGCGKTSLVKELCHANISVEQTISYTTRTMRQGEENLKDYHFVSKTHVRSILRWMQDVLAKNKGKNHNT